MKVNDVFNIVVFSNIIFTIVSVLFGMALLGTASYAITLVLIIVMGNDLKIYKQEYLRLLILFFLFLLPIICHLIIHRDYSWFYLIHYVLSIFAGLYVSRRFFYINFNLLLYIVSLIFTVYILFFSDTGNSEFVNRTYYMVPILIIWLLAVFKEHLLGNDFDVKLLFCVTVISVLSFSRSAMLSIALVYLSIYVNNLMKGKYSFIRLSFLVLTPFVALVIFASYYNVFLNNEAVARIGERGLDSGRYAFWLWYLINQDFKSLIFGSNTYEVWQQLDLLFFKDNGRHTLHNSFLQLHIHGGLVAVIFSLVMMLRLVTAAKGKECIVILSVLFVFMSKVFFDTVLFPQRFDFLFFALYFVVLNHLALSKNK